MSAQNQPYPTRLQTAQGLDPRTRHQVALANQQQHYQRQQPQQQQQQQQQQQYYLPPDPVLPQPAILRDPDDGMPATSEFVRKLYRFVDIILSPLPVFFMLIPLQHACRARICLHRLLGCSGRLFHRKGHDRVHKGHPSPSLQTLQLCLVRPPA